MYFSAYDPELHVLVCRLTGDISQADWDRCCSETRVLINKAREAKEKPLVINWVGKECAPPNAEQRQQIAELAVSAVNLDYLVVLVTPSALVRGVMTALRWIRPQPKGTAVTLVPDSAAALRWLKKEREEQAASAETLLRRAAEGAQ